MPYSTPATDAVTNISKLLYEMYTTMNNPEYSDSLTGFSKMASVVSQVYIESKLIDEDIMVPLMGTLNQIYISYVLTALQLNNVISQYSVVRRALARVTTESYQDVFDQIDSHFGLDKQSIVPSMEASNIVEVDKKVAHLASGKVIEFDFIVGTGRSIDTVDKTETSGRSDGSGGSSTSTTQTDRRDNKPITVTVPIHVSLLPREVTSAVADAFLTLNFEQSVERRWAKVKAGEISLFRDFLLSRDLVARYSKAMKEDNTNALRGMLDSSNTSRNKKFQKIINKGEGSNNIASSILVFEKRTFDKAAHEGGFNFSHPADRQVFFDAALAMLVVVVDTMYNTIDIYYNSMSQYSTFTFRMIEKTGNAKDSIDMKTVMATLAKGSAPKF